MSFNINHFYRFEDFTVDVGQKVLLRHDSPVPLPPKVLATLLILIENNGRIVDKDELMNRLWPDTFVEESNLTYNIQQLRKTLNDDARYPRYVETVPRRGYRFIANIEEVSGNGSDRGRLSENNAPGPTSISTKTGAIGESPIGRRVNKRSLAWTATMVLVAVAAALMVWILSRRSDERLGDLVAALPLNIERLTATGQAFHPAISPDGKYVAYTRLIDRKHSIWLRQLATQTSIQVAAFDHPVVGIAFASGGEYLYFAKSEPPALYRVPLLGGVPVKLIDGLASGKFRLAGDDQHIAFVRRSINDNGQSQYSLMVAGADGTGERTLLTRTYPERLDGPAWSPDGRSIVCSLGSSAGGDQSVGLIEVAASGDSWRELGGEKFAQIAGIVWLPEKGLLVSAKRGPDEYRQIWQITYPDMAIRQITNGHQNYGGISITADGYRVLTSEVTRVSNLWTADGRGAQTLKKITAAVDNFAWTPDRRLVYSSLAGGNRDLWIMMPDGTEQKQLTARDATDANPAVTVDGSYVVFVSPHGGSFQIWRMNFDGTDHIQLTQGPPKNFPAVSSDGKWVLYNSTDNWDLWKVSIDGGEPLRMTEQTCRFPSVSPDGSMIACVGEHTPGKVLVLPFEGGPVLKEFDLAGHFSGTRIQWTPDGSELIYATFHNGVTTMSRQMMSNGKKEQLATFEDELFDFGFSPDGHHLAVTRGEWQNDLLLINDFRRILR